MTTEIATFTCSICGEPSTGICVGCTKDACRNHRCERCKRCSDCCECDVPLSAAEPEAETPPLAVPQASEAPDMNLPPDNVIQKLAEAEQAAAEADPLDLLAEPEERTGDDGR